MAWTSELTPGAVADLLQIHSYLISIQHQSFGHDLASAETLATSRINHIEASIDRIENSPFIGTAIRGQNRTFRHVTIDRAIYWFRTDEKRETVVIEAIYFGGQDHFSRFMNRLTENGEAG